MDCYDVVVVGAGPAGLECARQIAKAGRSVLVVERFKDFLKDNFSSAGTTVETLAQFDLPKEIVGSSWNAVTCVSSHGSHTWHSEKELGYVLDFAELRSFLSGEVQKFGGTVLMGHLFSKIEQEASGENLVEIKNLASGETCHIWAKFVVDGTGLLRSVMRQVAKLPDDYEEGVGLEYVIAVPESDYRPEELIFLVGFRWIPHGYSWVFPMGSNQLKVGSMYWMQKEKLPRPLHQYVETVISDYLEIKNPKILEKHGGRITYSVGQNDVYVHDSVVSVGDAISAINPLGGEGIRHGMQSGRFAAEAILKRTAEEVQDLGPYERAMKEYFGLKWKRSSSAALLCYRKLKDPHFDYGVKIASVIPTQQMMDVLFYYNFGKGILSSILKRFKSIE